MINDTKNSPEFSLRFNHFWSNALANLDANAQVEGFAVVVAVE